MKGAGQGWLRFGIGPWTPCTAAGTPRRCGFLPENKTAPGWSFCRSRPPYLSSVLLFLLIMWGIVWGINFEAKRKGPLRGLKSLLLLGGRWATRTPDLWFRRPTLYPPELIARASKILSYGLGLSRKLGGTAGATAAFCRKTSVLRPLRPTTLF